MSARDLPGEYFRAGAGAVIRRPDGRVLAFERVNLPGTWQLPQGGLNADENPADAVLREVREETGISLDPVRHRRDRVSPLLAYELPEEYRTPRTGRGQVHAWFVFDVDPDDVVPDLSSSEEFSAWRWMRLGELLEACITFRRPVYEELAKRI